MNMTAEQIEIAIPAGPPAAGRRILVVTADAATRRSLTAMLEPRGFQVLDVASGEDAVHHWQHSRTELVLMDERLPGMDGYETTRRIKALLGEYPAPVVLLSSGDEGRAIRRCFDAGGNDLVNRPVDEEVLVARLEAVLATSIDYGRQIEQRRELAYYRDMMEREQQVARKIFASIMAQDRLDRDNIRYRLSPMSVFNGDLLLAADTPDGGNHLLIGDFTGHGLAASIGTLPTSEIFYAMTAKGFGIVDVLAEINSRLRGLLPVGMFLAVCGMELDSTGSTAKIWNGGIPDLLVRRAGNAGLERLASRHLPLGVVEAAAFERDLDLLSLNAGDRVYLYTDGVIETRAPSGELFGMQALMKLAADAGADEEVYGRILARLEAFRGGRDQSDDVTLLEYTCAPGARPLPEARHRAGPPAVRTGASTRWHLCLQLDPDALRSFDPRPVVTQILMDIQGQYRHRDNLYTILAELYANAVEHGLLGLGSRHRSGAEGRLGRLRERETRLAALAEGLVTIDVQHHPRPGGGQLLIGVQDTGAGFDPGPATGRPPDVGGLRRVEESGGRLTVHPPGNRVTVAYQWDGGYG